MQVTLPLGGTSIVADLAAHDVSRPGEKTEIDIDMTRAIVIDPADRKGHLTSGEAAMATKPASRGIKLFGTDVPDGKRRTLTAGPITAVFDNGALRYIRFDGAEVLRGIAYPGARQELGHLRARDRRT